MVSRLVRLRARGSLGAATLEYVAAISLAALLCTSAIFSVTGFHFDVVAQEAICKVRAALSVGSCAAAPDPPPAQAPPFNPKPPKCKISEHSDKVNFAVIIGVVKIGQNAGFVATTYSDGSVTFTATDGGELGLETGVDTKIEVGKVQRGGGIDFGGGVTYEAGSTWTFKDAAEAESMRKQLNEYIGQQDQLKRNPSMYMWLWLIGEKHPPKLPSQLVSTIGTKADVEGKLGVDFPFAKDPLAPPGTKPKSLKLADVGVKFGTTGKWTQINDTATGSTTYTTGGDYYSQRGANAGPVGAERKWIKGSSLAITRDKDNKITKVTFVTTREGKATDSLGASQNDLGGKASSSDASGELTVTTTSLDVTDPTQRALAEQWVTAQEHDLTGYISPETLMPSTLVEGDAFQNLMYTNATISNVQYDNVTDKVGFAAKVKAGVSIGVDLSLETTDSKAAKATYLDVPGPDRTRPPVDFPECHAG